MTAHTWFYSLPSPLSAAASEKLRTDFAYFLDNWKSHGRPVSGSIDIRYDRFIVVQSDTSEERPSGCSIDSMRHAVEEILTRHGVNWLDASWVFFQAPSGEIERLHFRDLPGAVANGTLSAGTLVFDHSLSQTDDLSRWEVPMAESWLRRYLPA